MQAEISELRSQNELLKRELQHLKSENKEAEARNRRAKETDPAASAVT
jgi:FtsZ-binding cell division protein ZapB